MIAPDTLKTYIAAGLPCAHLEVVGDGRHFEALIVSAEFEGLNRVRRQQRVNVVLRDRFDSGELHALSMKTMTPAEWEAARG